jgi:hypothetical protein
VYSPTDAADCHAPQQIVLPRIATVLLGRIHERSRESDAAEGLDQRDLTGLCRVIGHGQPLGGERGARAVDAGHPHGGPLDRAQTAAAMHVLDGEGQRGRSSVRRLLGQIGRMRRHGLSATKRRRFKR